MISMNDTMVPRLSVAVHSRRCKRTRQPVVLVLFAAILHLSSSACCYAFQIQKQVASHYVINCRRRRPYILSNMAKYDREEVTQHDSVLGASLLFAGTAVGAGMIALPAETVDAGFIPSIFGLSLCWIFTYVSSLVTLEASWLASSTSSEQNNSEGSFLSIARTSLGIPGEILTALLFYFLLTAIIVAYVSEGGSLVSQFTREVSSLNASPAIGSLVFTSFFALLGISGTYAVDNINRVFVFGLVLSFFCLVSVGLPLVNINNLLQHTDFNMVYPNVISIGILSFGAQNVVPTLLEYLNYDTIKTRQAILIGSLIPLILYTIWEGVFLGVFDLSNANESSKLEVVSVLGKTGGPIVNDLVELFSLCAICSSMAGASVSLIDFFQDAISKKSSKSELEVDPEKKSRVSKTRILAAILALAPPVLLAYSYPDIFLVALEEAGLLGGVSLYGIIPAICILSFSRASISEEEMPGKLAGGDVTLVALAAISVALIVPEVRHLLSW